MSRRSLYEWVVGAGGALIRVSGGLLVLMVALVVGSLLWDFSVGMRIAIRRWAEGGGVDWMGFAALLGAVGGLVGIVWPIIIASSRDRRITRVEEIRANAPTPAPSIVLPPATDTSPTGGLINDAALGAASRAFAGAPGLGLLSQQRGALMRVLGGRFDLALVAVAVLLAFAAAWFVGGLVGPLLVVVTLGVLAYLFRGLWLPKWAGVVQWAKRLRAEWIARADDAPSYWEGPAKDEDHARYRAEYLRLALQPKRTRADLALLAEMLDGLDGYGDNPLAKPPTLKARAMASFGAAGAAVAPWVWMGVAGLVASCVFLYGWVRIEQSNARIACAQSELEGRTERQPCLDLAAERGVNGVLREALRGFQNVRPVDVGAAVETARETAVLNQRNRDRERAAAERRRRAQRDDVQSIRDNRAPDWDGRLRDLAEPSLAPIPGDAGTAPGDGAAGGMSGGGASVDAVPEPGASAPPSQR